MKTKARRKPKARLKKTDETRQTHSIRFSPSEARSVQLLANEFASGDFSEWVRYASQHFRPRATDLATESKARNP